MVKGDIMTEIIKPRCMTPKSTYTFDYPQILELEEKQIDNFWNPKEPQVEKDLHCILTEMSQEETHGIITCLKLFTLYELVVGNEYWLGRFKRMFPRPEFQRLAATNGFMELSVHAPFYSDINTLLGLGTDEFYSSYVDDPVLKERMEFIDEIVGRKGDIFDDLISLAVFSIVEGAVLYSSFAYLKSYQVNGKNKIGAIVAGVDFSVRDENLHSLGGAMSFLIAIEEMREIGSITEEKYQEIVRRVKEAAFKLAQHEFRIIDMIFEKGDSGNQKESMKQFVRSRINLCLQNLLMPSIFSYDDIGENKFATWFYANINMPTIHDFFVNLGSQYNRDWRETAFAVEPNKYMLEDEE
jgi:ribonucleotide reductase beta subunit family protein with ferritin-like domain